jgi:hypothetical protein
MKANNLAYLKIEASAESKCFFDKVEKVAKEQEVRSSVNLHKRFIGFEGEIKPDKDKAKRLLSSITNAFKNRVTKTDLYYKELKQAEGSLKAYASGKTDTIKMATQSLNGLRGICGLGKLEASTNKSGGKSVKLENLNSVNKQFNSELRLLDKGELDKKHVFQLGYPTSFLIKEGGLENYPIELHASRLTDKASKDYKNNHPFDIMDVVAFYQRLLIDLF